MAAVASSVGVKMKARLYDTENWITIEPMGNDSDI